MLRNLRVLAVSLTMAWLAGCSSQDFGTPMGGMSDVVDSGKEYLPKDASTELRAQRLANALLAWQRQRGLVNEDYFVGADDVLLVTIYDLEKPGEPSAIKLTVTQDGNIALPLLGPTEVRGQTVRQIEDKISRLYAGEYLKDPRVTVDMAEYRSAPVLVTGAVGKPGIYYLQHNSSTILEMLSLSQGLSAGAGQQLLIIRNRGTNAVPAQADTIAGDVDPEDAEDYDFSQYTEPTNTLAVAEPTLAVETADTNAVTPIEPTKKRKRKVVGPLAQKESATSATNTVASAAPAEEPAKRKSKRAKDAPVEQTPPLAVAEDPHEETARHNAASGAEMITVDLKRLLDQGDIRLNVTILGGDIVTIPAKQARHVYVMGYVQRAGAFEIEAGHESMPALQAVALAGGLASAARAQNSFLIRSSAKGQAIDVDLTKIARGTRPPVFLQPGDTLVVGSSWFAKVGEFIKPSVSAGASYTPVP